MARQRAGCGRIKGGGPTEGPPWTSAYPNQAPRPPAKAWRKACAGRPGGPAAAAGSRTRAKRARRKRPGGMRMDGVKVEEEQVGQGRQPRPRGEVSLPPQSPRGHGVRSGRIPQPGSDPQRSSLSHAPTRASRGVHRQGRAFVSLSSLSSRLLPTTRLMRVWGVYRKRVAGSRSWRPPVSAWEEGAGSAARAARRDDGPACRTSGPLSPRWRRVEAAPMEKGTSSCALVCAIRAGRARAREKESRSETRSN